MTIRFYILPAEANGAHRGPAYFNWRMDPDPPGISDPWSWVYYGAIDRGVICSDISDINHASLVAHADVYAFPVNIDTTMTQQQQNELGTFLESYAIPGNWLTGTQTFRAVLRTVTSMFLFIQRVSVLYGGNPLNSGITLNTLWRNVPSALRAAIYDAALARGYSGTISNNTTIRNLLKELADLWGDAPIYMGLAVL